MSKIHVGDWVRSISNDSTSGELGLVIAKARRQGGAVRHDGRVKAGAGFVVDIWGESFIFNDNELRLDVDQYRSYR